VKDVDRTDRLLVGHDLSLLRRGAVLTDGMSIFNVLDIHRRVDGYWYQLENAGAPEFKAWFRQADLLELAYGRGERRAQREVGF
jgi:hypothetical protein